MTNNDILRSLRQVLGINESTIVDIFKQADHKIEQNAVTAYLKEGDETGYIECKDNIMSLFLDGLIAFRRGKKESNPAQVKLVFPPLTNNAILKKLRIAFDLKEEDLLELMFLANYESNKNELGALFRKPGHKHYRECSDEFLMGFLVGLSHRQWN